MFPILFPLLAFGVFDSSFVGGQDWTEEFATAPWDGKWFPNAPNYVDNNPTTEYVRTSAHQDLHDSHHGIKMGIPSKDCDDAKTNLTIDWDENPVNYTCFDDKTEYQPRESVHPQLIQETIPKGYHSPHYCMSGPITYNKVIPTFGGHRPLWPKYGEYRFVPVQRWLHSSEHGAIVMLYHPCANANEVDALRKLVTGCLWRHIITPYNLVSKERPLVLVTWGYRLEMSKVDPSIVLSFIKKAALKGPERLSRDGQFTNGIIKVADVISDKVDSVLCPNNPDNEIATDGMME